MHATFEYGAAVSAPTANCDPDRALVVTRQLLAFPRWYYLTAFVLLPVVFVILPDKNLQDVVQLERLAPQIERAQALAPEARDLISRMVARQGALAGPDGSAQELRRTAAIEQVTHAMKAKEPDTIASSGSRPPQE